MKMKKFLLPAFLCLSMCLVAQDSSSEAHVQTGTREDKATKKEKNKNSNVDDLNAGTFSESVAEAVTRRLRDALEGHSQRLMLSAFDADKMNDYPGFEGQIEAFFDHYVSFRVHIRILQATAEAEKGIILTDFEMEALPSGEAAPLRKHDEIRLELERGSKGWKIVEIKSRDFFS